MSSPSRRLPLLAVAATLAALAAGCTGGNRATADDPTMHSPTPATAQLLARAALAPCPTTQPAAAPPGGLPDLTLDCLGTGPAVHLGGLRGTPTVVNVWGSWCTPCQREVPYFDEVYAAAHGRLRVLGIDTEDSTRSALDFAAHVGMHWPSVVDADRLVLTRYNPGPPVTLYVDRSGRVVHVHRGPYDDAAALRADVARYLSVRL